MAYIELNQINVERSTLSGMSTKKGPIAIPIGSFHFIPCDEGGAYVIFGGNVILVNESYEYIMQMISYHCPVIRSPDSED